MYCKQCGEKETAAADGLCLDCVNQNRKDEMSLLILEKEGHTRHYASRIVWGDGECECGKGQ